jgi:hypothetical protein
MQNGKENIYQSDTIQTQNVCALHLNPTPLGEVNGNALNIEIVV